MNFFWVGLSNLRMVLVSAWLIFSAPDKTIFLVSVGSISTTLAKFALLEIVEDATPYSFAKFSLVLAGSGIKLSD